MYGTAEAAKEDPKGKSGQTFHEEHRNSLLHKQTPTTMVAEPN